jgi:hypothetical protein
MEIKHFNKFINMTTESIGTRRFPLTCEYHVMTYGTNPGTTMIRLEKKDGSKNEFLKDVQFLKNINFITISVDSFNDVIEIIISKESTQKLLESYIMIINNV